MDLDLVQVRKLSLQLFTQALSPFLRGMRLAKLTPSISG